MKNLKLNILILPFAFLLAGCYTQIAMHPSEYERVKKEKESHSNEEEVYYDDDAYGDTSEYGYDEETYYEDDKNYYYGSYYPYSRYYWGYYPRISFGFHYGYSWYNPYCWDPFYYSVWCGPYYYPYYYSYFYYPGYYYPGYYYPYYGKYWAHNPGVIRERTKAGLRIRNNDGTRGSITSRGTLTRGNNTSTGIRTRDRIGDSDILNVNTPTRTRITDGTRTTDIKRRDINDENTRTRVSTETRKTDDNKTSVRNKTTEEKNRVIIPRTTKTPENKGTTTRSTDRNREQKPNVTKEKRPTKKSGVREEGKRKSTGREYTPPRRTSTPPNKTVSPPRNNPPQRNSTPPQNRGGNSGSRGSGNNNSGDRTR